MHCLKCNNSLNYYQWRKDIYTCIERETNPDRYQFDNTLKAFVYCEKGWSRDSANEVTCYEKCPVPLYLDPNSSNECVEECFDENNYKDNPTRECVEQCDRNLFLYNRYCVEICPDDKPYFYINENDENVCIDSCMEDAPFLYNNSNCVAECPREVYKVVDNICTAPIIIITEEKDIVIDVPKEEVFEFINIASFSSEGKKSHRR